MDRAWFCCERETGLDYLIIGLATGSLFAIVGFVLREIGTRPASSVTGWSIRAGNSLMVVGVFVWAVTGAVALADMDDGTGRTMVLVAAALGLIGAVLSTVLLGHHQQSIPKPEVVESVASTAATEGWSPPVPEVETVVPPDRGEGDANPELESSQLESAVQDERSADFWLKTWLQPELSNGEGSAESKSENSMIDIGVESGSFLETGFWSEDTALDPPVDLPVPKDIETSSATLLSHASNGTNEPSGSSEPDGTDPEPASSYAS